jgi:hypothetical protein
VVHFVLLIIKVGPLVTCVRHFIKIAWTGRYLWISVIFNLNVLKPVLHPWKISLENSVLQYFIPSSLLPKNVKIKIYKTIILPIALYGCETWSFMLKEENSLRVFENSVLRRIFWIRRGEVTGSWRKLHNEELHNFYSSPNTVTVIKWRNMSWAGHVACMGAMWNAYKILVEKPERKSPLGRPRRRWMNNIDTDLKKIGLVVLIGFI